MNSLNPYVANTLLGCKAAILKIHSGATRPGFSQVSIRCGRDCWQISLVPREELDRMWYCVIELTPDWVL